MAALVFFARKPVLYVLVAGCAVSMLASGRFTPRLIVDGAMSFAFVPVFTLAAFALVCGRAPRRIPFTSAVDRFYAGNVPWLLWLLAGAGVGAFVSPRDVWPWIVRLTLIGIGVATWALVIDYRFFRRVMGRTPLSAAGELIVQRALSWTAIATYFLGYAFLSDIWPGLLERIGL